MSLKPASLSGLWQGFDEVVGLGTLLQSGLLATSQRL